MGDKIAIFLPSLRGGGAERQMLNLAEGFAARKMSVDLVLARAEGPFLSSIPESINVIDLHAARVIFSLPALVFYLKREKPKALLSALAHANVVAIIARKLAGVATRLVISEHNIPSVKKFQDVNKRGRFLPQFMRLFYPWADAIVAVSRGVKTDLEVNLDISSPAIKVIYNPVITDSLYSKAKQSVEHPWFKEQQKIVLAVGRLNKIKDYPSLIKAFAKVKHKTDARLVILGDGEERQFLQSLIEASGLSADVDLPGFVENPYAYMQKAAVFVLSSISEGLSSVLIEALAVGTPVVATDCPTGPGEVLESGKYGKLVKVGDIDAIADGIIEQLENPDGYPKRDLSDFESEYVIDHYLEILTWPSENKHAANS